MRSPTILLYMLTKGTQFYEIWSQEINPSYFICAHHQTTASSTDDSRVYGVKLVEFLIRAGAVLIEESCRLGGPTTYDDDDLLGQLMGNSDTGRKLFFYKDHLIKLRVGNDGSCSIEDWYSTGQKSIIPQFAEYLMPVEKGKVSILLQGNQGLTVKQLDFEPPVIKDLELNYGAGFTKIATQIIGKLEKRGSSIQIYHGPPGCGKTTWIKYLTSVIDKEFIFVPVGLASELSSPSFLNILLDHKNSILVLEDAEKALQSREIDDHNTSTVSGLVS